MTSVCGTSSHLRSTATPTVNNVTIMSDYQLSNGNQVFIISEVLFVTEAVVSKLHQVSPYNIILSGFRVSPTEKVQGFNRQLI